MSVSSLRFTVGNLLYTARISDLHSQDLSLSLALSRSRDREVKRPISLSAQVAGGQNTCWLAFSGDTYVAGSLFFSRNSAGVMRRDGLKRNGTRQGASRLLPSLFGHNALVSFSSLLDHRHTTLTTKHSSITVLENLLLYLQTVPITAGQGVTT